jgi:hypothetical protein
MHLNMKKLKKKKKRQIEKLIESQRGVLNNFFFINNKQNIEDNLGKKLINK